MTVVNVTPGEDFQGSWPFGNDFVIQDFAAIMAYSDADDCPGGFVMGGGTEPLLTVKLTVSPSHTAIGLSWCHVLGNPSVIQILLRILMIALGDGRAFYDFTICLSALYENVDPSMLPPPPSLYRHVFPLPYCASDAVSRNFLTRMPHLSQDYAPKKLFQMYADVEARTDHVQLRFTGASLDGIRALAGEGAGDVRLSVQDCLTAYLVVTLSKCLEKPIKRVINALDVSNFKGRI